MDSLKERAKEKGVETNEEVIYDKSAWDPNTYTDDKDEYQDLEINSFEEFFDKNVVVALYNEKMYLYRTHTLILKSLLCELNLKQSQIPYTMIVKVNSMLLMKILI
ncbi:hypothetical protein AAFP94_14350 [Flavobacteriaceae bacterium MJ-SS4]|uniref:hypothetical protein n=1 Tax=Gilvirhabdus luticola TaxID=3079858 RepID=UPI0032DD1F77